MSNREQAKNKTKLARFDDVQFKAGALEQDGKKVAAQLQKVREYEAAAHEKAGHEFKKADEFWVSLPPLNRCQARRTPPTAPSPVVELTSFVNSRICDGPIGWARHGRSDGQRATAAGLLALLMHGLMKRGRPVRVRK